MWAENVRLRRRGTPVAWQAMYCLELRANGADEAEQSLLRRGASTSLPAPAPCSTLTPTPTPPPSPTPSPESASYPPPSPPSRPPFISGRVHPVWPGAPAPGLASGAAGRGTLGGSHHVREDAWEMGTGRAPSRDGVGGFRVPALPQTELPYPRLTAVTRGVGHDPALGPQPLTVTICVAVGSGCASWCRDPDPSAADCGLQPPGGQPGHGECPHG